ncbi:hypothetical protein [Pedobacter psychroterrae]|uniref:Uncharacterized protein n=1 Tax=Pedobacter psychroterrae TaxID=2530453 RepID=A0A4R0NQ74_9SPHI|nr:hypothetical protein [Pedobacter psychroterrae]TCD01214.1 hypothetical protein EZ437_10665 [Pedobacter psychroterrae]
MSITTGLWIVSIPTGNWPLMITRWNAVFLCDKLPSMAEHFDPYCDLQLLGLSTILTNARNKNTEKLLQDYLTFIPDLADFANLDPQVLKTKFKDNVGPLITIAGNNRFKFMIGNNN